MGSKDEIVRYSIEHRFTEQIPLDECCGTIPTELFVSCKEYFIRCRFCGKQTKIHKHLYEARQAWNRGEAWA